MFRDWKPAYQQIPFNTRNQQSRACLLHPRAFRNRKSPEQKRLLPCFYLFPSLYLPSFALALSLSFSLPYSPLILLDTTAPPSTSTLLQFPTRRRVSLCISITSDDPLLQRRFHRIDFRPSTEGLSEGFIHPFFFLLFLPFSLLFLCSLPPPFFFLNFISFHTTSHNLFYLQVPSQISFRLL